MSTATLPPLRPLAVAGSPALRLLPTTVPPGPAAPARPALRVIEGGRAPSRQAARARYRRRRLGAVVALVAVVAASFLLAGAISARLAGGGHPSSAVGAPSPTPAVAVGAAGVAAPSGYHVVQPGDTLWSIAAAIAPGSDLRRTVDRLAELNGGGELAVGTRLRLP